MLHSGMKRAASMTLTFALWAGVWAEEPTAAGRVTKLEGACIPSFTGICKSRHPSSFADRPSLQSAGECKQGFLCEASMMRLMPAPASGGDTISKPHLAGWSNGSWQSLQYSVLITHPDAHLCPDGRRPQPDVQALPCSWFLIQVFTCACTNVSHLTRHLPAINSISTICSFDHKSLRAWPFDISLVSLFQMLLATMQSIDPMIVDKTQCMRPGMRFMWVLA